MPVLVDASAFAVRCSCAGMTLWRTAPERKPPPEQIEHTISRSDEGKSRKFSHPLFAASVAGLSNAHLEVTGERMSPLGCIRLTRARPRQRTLRLAWLEEVAGGNLHSPNHIGATIETAKFRDKVSKKWERI
jgi:hypothetical protein